MLRDYYYLIVYIIYNTVNRDLWIPELRIKSCHVMSWYKLICKCWFYSCCKIHLIHGIVSKQKTSFHLKGFLKPQFIKDGINCYQNFYLYNNNHKRRSLWFLDFHLMTKYNTHNMSKKIEGLSFQLLCNDLDLVSNSNSIVNLDCTIS